MAGFPHDELVEINRVMKTELPPHPEQVTYQHWESHAVHIEWQRALEALMRDPDAELPAS